MNERASAATLHRVRRRIVLALIALAALAWFLSSTHGKDCHYNVNLSPRMVCTER